MPLVSEPEVVKFVEKDAMFSSHGCFTSLACLEAFEYYSYRWIRLSDVLLMKTEQNFLFGIHQEVCAVNKVHVSQNGAEREGSRTTGRSMAMALATR